MASQDSKPRRKPLTYGKKTSNRPLPMYNFLDSDPGVVTNESNKLQEKLPDKSLGRPLQKRSHNAELIQKTNGVYCSGDGSSISLNSLTEDKLDHMYNGSAASLFDLTSSDEDVEMQTIRKKRKLTPVRRGIKQVQELGRKDSAVPKSHENHAQGIAAAQSVEIISVLSGSEQLRANSKPMSRSAVKLKPRKRSPAPRKVAAAKITTDRVENEEEVRVVSMTSSPTPPHTPGRISVETLRSHSNTPSTQLIDQLNRSIPLGSCSTKHVNRVASQTHDEGGVPSPSQLAMRYLRLTPEESVQLEVEEGEDRNSLQGRPLTPSRSRRRLVDALDSPRKRSTSEGIDIGSPTSSERSSVNGEVGACELVQHDVLQTKKNQIGKHGQPSSKPMAAIPIAGPKVTYAKQRSHLSDMVLEDLSDLAVPSLAHLVDPVPTTKASVNPSFSSQRSREELNDEEDATGGAIRSIHELRQAGENSRFQGNLDSIFEDLEAGGRTGRSRRLRGLMLLTQKFLEPSFCQRFFENGMHQRFANHARNEQDILSSMLTSCAFSILLSSCKPSLKVQQQVFNAVVNSAAPLLAETRELPKFVKSLAKDRKQNLSGATCKDVIEFQPTILASQMWTKPQPTNVTPQLVALRSIEIAVRGLRESKDFETPLPNVVFSQLVVILEDAVSNHNIDLAATESVLKLESTISVLEFSALSPGLFGDGRNEAATRLCVLGPLLAKAEMLPRERYNKIEQLVLRLIISVTNNNDVLCESLGQTVLISAISGIVKKNFLELAEYADSGKALDEMKLESVILALGSLINFAECSQSSRLSMNRIDSAGGSFVEWLVAAFTRRAGKASEASSLEQTHALVSFGYLSMLICALCLGDEIRNTVRASMKSRSLHPLIVAVEEFLNYFRTVEQVMVEEEASNNFTERFGGIVHELREAEGIA